MTGRRQDISGPEARLREILERIADGRLLGATISLRAVGTREPCVELSEDLLIERCPRRGHLSDMVASAFASAVGRERRSS